MEGKIIERIQAQASVEGKKRFIYLGDGNGDYCPSLRLSAEDYEMPRKKYPLWQLICNNPQQLKAEVHEWSNGEELERILLQLIDRSIAADRKNAAQVFSVDCKFETIPMPSNEAHPLALRVPH